MVELDFIRNQCTEYSVPGFYSASKYHWDDRWKNHALVPLYTNTHTAETSSDQAVAIKNGTAPSNHHNRVSRFLWPPPIGHDHVLLVRCHRNVRRELTWTGFNNNWTGHSTASGVTN
ncbi:hypothetical protein MN608_04311 [Microdochium nivale]|nr:hypothetical protein MN608_04311 [Microdochium nivale]